MKDTRVIKQIEIDHKDRQQALTKKNQKRDYENRQKAKNNKKKNERQKINKAASHYLQLKAGNALKLSITTEKKGKEHWLDTKSRIAWWHRFPVEPTLFLVIAPHVTCIILNASSKNINHNLLLFSQRLGFCICRGQGFHSLDCRPFIGILKKFQLEILFIYDQ